MRRLWRFVYDVVLGRDIVGEPETLEERLLREPGWESAWGDDDV